METIAKSLLQLRQSCPLVLNVTNQVVMNLTANVLLAAGASPIMAHAESELEELVAKSNAVLINIGTLDAISVRAMRQAGQKARSIGLPVTLDPVGAGASRYRTETAQQLINDINPTVVRGNAGEILSLANGVAGSAASKGVDSLVQSEDVVEIAATLARRANCTVSVSGRVDIVTDGRRCARIANGHPIMTKVAGTGCSASALTSAFLAVAPTPYDAAVAAMAVIGVAGEIAADLSDGPGSFQTKLLDVLYALEPGALTDRLNLSQNTFSELERA